MKNTRKLTTAILILIALVIAFVLVITSNDVAYGDEEGYATPMVDEVRNEKPRVYLPYIVDWGLPTSTPTPTLTPTPAPTPTPTAQPRIYVLPNNSYYSYNIDGVDYLNIVGEVFNDTGSHISFVKITVNIFDRLGNHLSTNSFYTYLGDIAAGDKTCFNITFKKPIDWAYYEFERPTYWPNGNPLPNLVAFNHSGSYNSATGRYRILGQVRNNYYRPIEFVKPVGTLYNRFGTVIGCDFTFVASTDLLPGQASSFDLTFYGRDYNDVASYRMQVDGTSW